jgi:cbb3-type cytochrome oxidase subunit 3
MKALFASSEYGLIGLLLFFGLFVGILVWLFWPGSKEKFKEHGKIPLEDDKNE